MSVPNIKFNRRDNQLGISNAGDHNQLALCGCSVGGSLAVATPAKYTRTQDLIDALGKGTLVEAACFMIENFEVPVVVSRCAITTPGAYGTIDVTGVTGTSVVTTHGATTPYDEYDAQVKVKTGGTVGTAGIVVNYSLDDGRTWSADQSLGVATTLLIAEANVQFDFGVGTLVANDIAKTRTTGPQPNAAGYDAALLALQNTQLDWDGCLACFTAAATDVTNIETRAESMEAAEKEKIFFANVRTPSTSESEATYLTAQQTAFANIVAPFVSVGFGYERATSPILKAQLRRPQIWGVAGRFATTRPGRDLAAVEDGSLPSTIQITDDNGNPKEHDERIFPGADDSRFSTNRTWIKKQGVYINNARIMSASGSDIVFVQHRRVSNLVCTVVREALQRFESIDLFVDENTGYVLPEEANDIDVNVNAKLKTFVVDERDASSVIFKLNRTDNVLSTFKLKGSARIIPLAYAKFFEIDISFFNPALKVVPVAA